MDRIKDDALHLEQLPSIGDLELKQLQMGFLQELIAQRGQLQLLFTEEL